MGGLLNGTTVGAKLEAMLRNGSDGYRWVAAAVGANNAASYQLASDQAVMAIGGFNGSDPTPTLAEFQAMVRDGKIHYFIGGGGFGGPGGRRERRRDRFVGRRESASTSTTSSTT